MPPLLAPKVMLPLSECSSIVWVQGQITGSTLEVFANGVLVASGTAFGSNILMPLNPGVTLTPGASVAAQQTLGTDVSPLSPQPVQVQARPPVVGYVGFRSPLYVCGECVWLDGMVPGATVEIRVAGVVRGSGTAHLGNVVVGISPPLAPGEALEAQQDACGAPGLLTPGPASSLLPFVEGQRPLPPPKVTPPLKECQHAVLVTDAFSGARLTLDRTGSPSVSSCTSTGASWFWVTPLVLGETVTARQAYPACGLSSPNSAPVNVESAEPVPPPTVVGPLCAGATSVTVADLLPGSRVAIFQDGVELGQGEAPDSSAFDFPVPPLNGGSIITARQELCNIWSADSNGVMVDPQPATLPTPVIPGPLFECASVVRVENLFPGAWVYVHSTMLGAPIGEAQVTAKEMDIPVTPQLIAGDQIFAVQVGCGQSSAQSNLQTVLALKEVPIPKVQPPVDDCMRSIPVIDALPGARVDVFVNNVWRGSADAGGTLVQVPISGRLFPGDRVKARQRLCATITGFSQEEVVVRSPGRWYLANVTDLSGNPTNAEILAVHAALLHTGKIVYFGGDEHDQQQNIQGQIDHTRLFDCATFQIEKIGSPTHDVFCSSHAMLPDGRLLVAGGTESWSPGGHHSGHFEGLNTTWIFDPVAKSWIQSGNMDHGRWYPTLITMSDGRVLAISGHTDAGDPTPDSGGNPRHNNHSMELFNASPAPGGWNLVGNSSDIQSVNGWVFLYPRLHVLQGGDVFCSMPMADHHTRRWTPGPGTAWTDVVDGPYDAIYQGWNGTSVLLPLLPKNGYAASVLLCGDTTPKRIDLGAAAAPAWNPTGGRALAGNPIRQNLNAVLLPTGEMLVCGGVGNPNAESTTKVLAAELYHPDTNTWEIAAEATVIRNYHSVALLIPDGRVWTAGSNRNAQPGLGNRELLIEIYEPWYCCRNRPEITAVSRSFVAYQQAFEVRSPQASSIRRVAAVHPGSVTHAYNSDQRYVGLEFKHPGGDQLEVLAPPDGTIAVPGYYLLFVIDQDGVPSVGKFIRFGLG